MVQIVISSGGTGALAQWVLLELQGEVEPRQSGDLAGSLLGDLHYTCEVRLDTAGTCRGQPSPASPSALPRVSLCSSWGTTSSTGRWCSWRSRLLCW
uniref:Chromosome transmission fidelity factor 8 n=1 Tax=Zonotrichia albicollis TaxID=44394 RepID=A0A8D2MC32_ZONAL